MSDIPRYLFCPACRMESMIYEGSSNTTHFYRCIQCGLRLDWRWMDKLFIFNRPLTFKEQAFLSKVMQEEKKKIMRAYLVQTFWILEEGVDYLQEEVDEE